MTIESLEARRLFTVTVTEGYPGFYEIHGTAGGDNVDASIDMAAETLTVNGQTYQDVSYVVAYGYGGNDHITIMAANGPGNIAAAVSAGDGNDFIMLNVDGGVWAGGGNDQLYLLHSFRGEAYGEDGNDFISISGITPDAEIRGGNGNDYIECNTSYYGVVVFGGEGNDTILGSEYDDQIYGEGGDDYLDGGGGNDMFYAVGYGADFVSGGEGADVAYLDDSDGHVDVEQIYYL